MNPFSRKAKLANEMAHQQSYSAEPYREGIEYTPEAWAYGLRALPGNLADDLQWLAEYTMGGKPRPRYVSNALNELTQVNEMGYTPQTEWEQGVAFAPELIYDPIAIAGMPYAAYKGVKGLPNALGTISEEMARTPMRNQLGILAGPNAKNADLGMLARAQEMKAQGVPTDDIYSETRWWLDHPDGVPRFEIDDSGASLTNWEKSKHGQANVDWPDRQGLPTAISAPDYLYHPNLEDAYWPVREDAPGVFFERGGYKGKYSPSDDTINLNLYQLTDDESQKSTALHELQHAIQSRENMAMGGNPSVFSSSQPINPKWGKWADLSTTDDYIDYQMLRDSKAYRDELEASNKLWNQKYKARFDAVTAERPPRGSGGMDEYRAKYRKILDEFNAEVEAPISNKVQAYADRFGDLAAEPQRYLSPHEGYRHLAGEADARLVQNRMNMSMDERLADPFYRNYDVPLEDQIVRFDDGPSMATVWQGSPHKYDGVPDPTKIGTGEGAQAYGYGHYYGGAEATGRAYQQSLSPGGVVNHSIDRINDALDLEEALGKYVPSYIIDNATRRAGKMGGVDEAIAQIDELAPQLIKANNGYGDDMLLEKEVLQAYRDKIKVSDVNTGYLYKLDLDDNAIANMLDWDAPLSEQPGIINALRNSKSKIVRDTIKRMEDSGFKYSGDLGDYTGETLNRMLSLNFDGVSNSKKASDAFRKAGIPGIKYWDEGSRAAGEGSRNYVVFPGNENLITPLERNGEPLGLLGMGRKEKGL